MPQGGARWRDVLVLFALGVVIAGGLVHYGRDAVGDRATRAGSVTQGTPTAEATVAAEGVPPTGPAQPAKTCWDGRATSSLRVCGLPEGARGLSWVFPSFARDRASCHRARPHAGSHPVVESFECFLRTAGEPVTITYDRVADAAQLERWLLARFGAAAARAVPGPAGGRLVVEPGGRPARITGTYRRFPYAVSVHATDRWVARRAWRTLVEQRPADQLRGVVG